MKGNTKMNKMKKMPKAKMPKVTGKKPKKVKPTGKAKPQPAGQKVTMFKAAVILNERAAKLYQISSHLADAIIATPKAPLSAVKMAVTLQMGFAVASAASLDLIGKMKCGKSAAKPVKIEKTIKPVKCDLKHDAKAAMKLNAVKNAAKLTLAVADKIARAKELKRARDARYRAKKRAQKLAAQKKCK